MHWFILPFNPLCPKFLLGTDVTPRVLVPNRGISENKVRPRFHWARQDHLPQSPAACLPHLLQTTKAGVAGQRGPWKWPVHPNRQAGRLSPCPAVDPPASWGLEDFLPPPQHLCSLVTSVPGEKVTSGHPETCPPRVTTAPLRPSCSLSVSLFSFSCSSTPSSVLPPFLASSSGDFGCCYCCNQVSETGWLTWKTVKVRECEQEKGIQPSILETESAKSLMQTHPPTTVSPQVAMVGQQVPPPNRKLNEPKVSPPCEAMSPMI